MTSVDTTKLTAARAAANEVRGMYLSSVRDGVMTPEDVIAEAAREGNEPLRKIRLMRLLTAQEKYSEATAARLVDEVIRVSGAWPMQRSDATVAWLIDRRACGRRLIAWANLRRTREVTPWPGFPFTPKPN